MPRDQPGHSSRPGGVRPPVVTGLPGTVRAPAGAPDWLRVFTAAERPDLWESAREAGTFADLWPEYNRHGNDTPTYFGQLAVRWAECQFLFVDAREDVPVARGRTIPFRWDGTLDDLPAGIDAAGLRAVSGTEAPTSLSALAAEVVRPLQGSGLSRLVISTMGEVARRAGLSVLVASVRPSWKDRYPLIPIDRYARWEREDGLPFDAWLRVHSRLGGTLLRCEPYSLRIEAHVGECGVLDGHGVSGGWQVHLHGGASSTCS